MRERGVGRRPCCCSIVLHFRNFRGWLRRLPLRIGRCYVVGRLSPVVTSSQPASIADLPDRTAHCPHLFTPPVQKQNETKTKRNGARTPEERLPLGARARQRIPTPTTTPPRHRTSRAVALSLRVPQHRRRRLPLESPIPNEVHIPTRGGDDHHVHE